MLVDEMQDTNPLQWAILEPLKDKTSLFCVGDDAQSIYGFRGADFENIHHFKERVPDAEIFKLEKNYRSTQEILDLSNWLLDQSPIHYDKKLEAYRGDGIKPRMHVFQMSLMKQNGLRSTLKSVIYWKVQLGMTYGVGAFSLCCKTYRGCIYSSQCSIPIYWWDEIT
jgi:superfamily I DNA/RNA helicase